VIGAAVLMSVPVCLLFSVAVFALSYGVEGWFHADVDDALRIVAPLALVFPFAQLSILFAQGLDRLNAFSTTYTIGSLAFVAGIVVLVWTGTTSVTAVLLVKAASMLVTAVLLVAWLRPRLGNARRHARRLIHDGRTYGFQVYVGRILSIGTYQMDVLMLAAYTDPKTVGYYVLAGAFAYGLGLPVLGIATALFPQLANAHELNAKWVRLGAVIGAGMVGIALLIAGPAIELIFSSKYSAAAALVGPLVGAEAIRGVTSLYNSYLSAQGRGRELRNAALVLTTSNIALNVTLIPAFGALGAAWASLLALAANLVAHIVGYRRSQGRPVLAGATE
jgi:O-antigen/teichoic acid export membrane protein